jgi:magnesium-dependent phosphatase 1
VPAILAAAQERSIPLALASRTHTPDRAQRLLKMLTVAQAGGQRGKAWDLFANRQIYPGDKRTHMKAIQKALGVAFEDMLFLDDEQRNVNVEQLGVCFWLVEDGVTAHALDRGVHEWRRRRASE